jgi:vacuolar-type H+-ATPase subunit H
MTGLDLVVGYLAAWAWRKARRVAGRADAEVDHMLDAGMDRLHELVATRLAGDPALRRLEDEAAADPKVPAVRERTRDRVRLALEDAAEADPEFAGRLEELVAEVRAAERRSGQHVAAAVTASEERSIAAGGDISGIAAAGDDAVNIQRR